MNPMESHVPVHPEVWRGTFRYEQTGAWMDHWYDGFCSCSLRCALADDPVGVDLHGREGAD